MPEDLMLEVRQVAEQYFSQMQRKFEDILRAGKFESEEKRLEHEGRTKRIQGIKTGYWKLAPRNSSDIGHIVCKNGVVMFEIGKSDYSRKEIKRILKKWNKEQKEFQKIKEKGKEMITLDNGAASAEEERNAIPAPDQPNTVSPQPDGDNCNISADIQIELPRYKCHKEVHAAKILKVFMPETHTYLVLEVNGKEVGITESKEYGEKHKPYAGGYYVVYEEGYTSFSPAEAFENGYKPYSLDKVGREERGEECESNFLSFAKEELKIIGAFNKESAYGGMLGDAVMELLKTFDAQGHSGGSAPLVVQLFSKVALFEPLAPITEKDEWSKVHERNGLDVYQCKRLSGLFKHGKDGVPYFLDAIVFKSDRPGDSFTGSVDGIKSRQHIKSFPFSPKTFYIDVVREPFDKDKHKTSNAVSCSDGDYVYHIKDMKQLNAVWEYYRKETELEGTFCSPELKQE